MDKMKYFRKIVFVNYGTDKIDTLLEQIPSWECEEEKIDMNSYKVLKNSDKNVKIYFLENSGCWASTNVLPINQVDGSDIYYEKGYDKSENQKEDLREDILYSLWLLINKVIKEEGLDFYCGLIPSDFDCGLL